MLTSLRHVTSLGENSLVFQGPGWLNEVGVSKIAMCQLYNTLEAREEWWPVIVDWRGAEENERGWTLPCRVDIPFIGTVISFTVRGTNRPDATAIDVSIADDSLLEHDLSCARLMRLDLLPGFSAAKSGEDGYLLLPCLAGALHRFSHSVSRTERFALYARQDQWALRSNFNCVGIKRNSLAWCAVVTGGDCDAEAVVRSHFDEDAEYSVHIGLVYRWDHTDERIPGDRTVRYFLLKPSSSGWAEFARCYRSFLREERGLQTWRQKYSRHPKIEQFARGFLMKIFQGGKTPSLDGRGEYQSAASFVEASAILAEMRSDGIEGITVELVGWNHEGHDGRYPSRFPVNPLEGGEAELRSLITWGNENGMIISVHDNALDSYEIGDDFCPDDGLVLRDGSRWRNIPWSGGFNWRMCPIPAMRHVRRDYTRMKDLGIDGHYYIDALAAFNTCHSPDHPADRQHYIAGVRDIMQFTRDLFGTLSTEVAFGAYFDLMDGVYIDDRASWMDGFTDFGHKYVDEVVPFLPVVLHNSVRFSRSNDSSDGKVGALRSLAWGAMPFIEVSARPAKKNHARPTYGEVEEFSREAYRLCCIEHGDLIEVDLDDVVEIEHDLFVTRYANGVELLVNARETAACICEAPVPALTALRRKSGA
ncbi:MAG TPA: DUF5696 domain-containing protein [Capsulimonadaceae bacterium]|jgi:hypothetical protein